MNDINIKISACLVVYNDAALLPRCLDSLAGVIDEIIIVHDGPVHDETEAIAARYGARFIIGPRSGIAEPIRHLSYEAARGEWILQIDADEYLSSELQKSIPDLIANNDIDAYEFVWPLYSGERYTTRQWPYKRCLFRRSSMSFIGLPNYVVEVGGKVKQVPLLLEHRPQYNNYSWKVFTSKWLPWARIQAQLYLKDFKDVPKFQYPHQDWPSNPALRRRFSIALAPLDAFVVFIKTLFPRGYRSGAGALKAALLLACFRIAVDWYIYQGKRILTSEEAQALCPCGAQQYKKYWYGLSSKTISILQCRHCGLARTWPIPLQGEILEQYYEDRPDYEDRFVSEALWRKFSRRALNLVKRHSPAQARVLDVGCNLGLFVDEARLAGFEASGIDMSAQAIEYGKKKYHFSEEELSHGTLETKQYKENSFDVVAYLHCFEHIEFPRQELKRAAHIIKTNGILFIEVPRFFSAWRFFLGHSWYCFSPFQHIWQFGLRGLKSLLEQEGFTIAKAYTRLSMHHELSLSFKGIVKFFIMAIAWLSGTGDNLIVVARKKIL